MIIFHVHDRQSPPPAHLRLNEAWTAVALPLADLNGTAAGNMRHCLFDVDVTAVPTALRIRAFMARSKPRGVRIFACRRGDRHAAIQSSSLGATNLIDRPVRPEILASLLPVPEAQAAEDEVPGSSVLCTIALDLAFRSVNAPSKLSSATFDAVTTELSREVAAIGIGAWLKPIQIHHAGTYQHCLMVMGIATAFGQELGFAAVDLTELTTAALLHDIGKARINQDLLDKSSRLTDEERAVFAKHPAWGHEFLVEHADVPGRVLDAVRHHHEYLDGSGYPDGIAGREIIDLTRLLTIADIFAALVERRAYKEPMPAKDALAVLRDLVAAGRLERALVEAFGPVAARVGASEGRAPGKGTRGSKQ